MKNKKTAPGNIRDFLAREILPRVQSDGGEFKVLELKGRKLALSMEGGCASCPTAACGLKGWLQGELARKFGVSFEITLVMKKYSF